MKEYLYQKMVPGFPLSFTFTVTEACQLACKYCYILGKNNHSRLEFETAKRAVDYLLENRDKFNQHGVSWEFIGGEPFIEIELIDKICDYIKRRMYELDHPWFEDYMFGFSTNGLMHNDPRVQAFIEKNKNHVDIGFSIDGNKEKHDMNRVYVDGRGSYDDVVKNVPKWLEQFPRASTKVTCAHADLPLIADSIIHLFELGIHTVNANVVFEDVWEEGDDKILEEQLIKLADMMIDGGYYKENTCSFFAEFERFGMPEVDDQNWCGSGRGMLAMDVEGNFYPCHRFLPISLSNPEKKLIIGNIEDGIDFNKLRPLLGLNRTAQSTDECNSCEVGVGCAWCTGFNYDAADSKTVYQRATYICKMHKARVRANKYFREKFEKVTGEKYNGKICKCDDCQ